MDRVGDVSPVQYWAAPDTWSVAEQADWLEPALADNTELAGMKL